MRCRLWFAHSVDDLPSLDEDLYRNLMILKNYNGDVENLALDFTVTVNGTPIAVWSLDRRELI